MLSDNENPENTQARVNNILYDWISAWIGEILARIVVEMRIVEKKKTMPRVDPVVIVHGGAGRIPQYARKFMLDEVKLFML